VSSVSKTLSTVSEASGDQSVVVSNGVDTITNVFTGTIAASSTADVNGDFGPAGRCLIGQPFTLTFTTTVGAGSLGGAGDGLQILSGTFYYNGSVPSVTAAMTIDGQTFTNFAPSGYTTGATADQFSYVPGSSTQSDFNVFAQQSYYQYDIAQAYVGVVGNGAYPANESIYVGGPLWAGRLPTWQGANLLSGSGGFSDTPDPLHNPSHDENLILNVTGVNVAAPGPTTVELATFTHDRGTEAPTGFTASVNWDGSTTAVSATSVTQTLDGVYHVMATLPSFAEEGNYPYTVTINDDGATTTVAGVQPVQGEPSISASLSTVSELDTASSGVEIATFTHGNGAEPASNFMVTADWGSGPVPVGLTETADGIYHVIAVPPFTSDGSYSVTVQITDDSGATATVIGTLVVSELPIVGSSATLASVNEGDPPATVTVATFTHANGLDAVSDFTATVNWGITGHTADPATVTENCDGSYTVTVTPPVFPDDINTPVVVTISEENVTTTVNDTLTVNEPAIVGSSATLTSVNEGAASTSVTVATFTHANGVEAAGAFTATVNWGITGRTADPALVSQNNDGSYTVTATQPVYPDDISTPVVVTISEDNVLTTVNDTLTVNEPAIMGTSATLTSVNEGAASASVTVATFTHANGVEAAGAFTATVNWGITGHTADPATVSQNTDGSYTVTATRPIFAEDSIYSVAVTISEDNTSTPVNDSLTVTKVTPTLTTNAGVTSATVYSTATLTDTATLTNNAPGDTGTGTFTLTAPDNTTVYTSPAYNETGNFTQGASASVSLTQLGNYTWHASYNDDGIVTSDNGVNETVTVGKAGSNTTVTWTDETSTTYDGNQHFATASWASTGADSGGGSLPVSCVGINGTVYGPTATAPTNAGQYQASASFAGDAFHTSSSGFANFTINKANQTITWATPAPIPWGAPLGANQLNASVAVNSGPGPAGGLTYNYTTGTVLSPAGVHTLSVTAAGSANYNAATASVQLTVLAQSIYTLDPTASKSFLVTSTSPVNLPGPVNVESTSATAYWAGDHSQVYDASSQVVGGAFFAVTSTVTPKPTTGVAPFLNPMVGLAGPSTAGLVYRDVAYYFDNAAHTIYPGIYRYIWLGSNTQVTMMPGMYLIEGSGVQITGNASLTGNGVTIYNANANYPNPGGLIAGITINTTGTVNLNAASTSTNGADPGVVIYQSPVINVALSLTANASTSITGSLYVPSAQVVIAGSGSLTPSVVADEFWVKGTVALTQMAGGSDGPQDGGDGFTLQADNLQVYVNDPAGYFTANDLAGIQDAINGWNAVIAPYGVTISETTDPTQANVVLDNGTTSASGSAVDGVLGCFNPLAGMEITILQGCNWYDGSDLTQIGAGQYDFQTVMSHELGHALGFGGSVDPTSPMVETLPAGTTHRMMSAADLNLVEVPEGADPERAAPIAPTVTTQAMRRSAGRMACAITHIAILSGRSRISWSFRSTHDHQIKRATFQQHGAVERSWPTSRSAQ
jgi:hypothetical protein